MSHPSLPHLLRHHRDFTAFRDTMLETSPSRHGPLWWGMWEQLVRPPAAGTFVDIGTGPGLLLGMLRARYPDGRVIGVEVQPVMLAAARPLAEACGAEIVEADVAAGPLPLPDGVADVVTAVHLFHELPFPPALLAEVQRLLRPGGVFVMYDWVKRPLQDYLEGGPLDEDTLQHYREHCLFSADDLEWMVTQAGFRVRELIGRRGGRYAIVVAEK